MVQILLKLYYQQCFYHLFHHHTILLWRQRCYYNSTAAQFKKPSLRIVTETQWYGKRGYFAFSSVPMVLLEQALGFVHRLLSRIRTCPPSLTVISGRVTWNFPQIPPIKACCLSVRWCLLPLRWMSWWRVMLSMWKMPLSVLACWHDSGEAGCPSLLGISPFSCQPVPLCSRRRWHILTATNPGMRDAWVCERLNDSPAFASRALENWYPVLAFYVLIALSYFCSPLVRFIPSKYSQVSCAEFLLWILSEWIIDQSQVWYQYSREIPAEHFWKGSICVYERK